MLSTDLGPPAGSVVSVRRLILHFLYTILLFVGPRYPAILLCCSTVILGGAFSTHLLGQERDGKLKAGATVK
jgi:hypothetical protein